MAHPVPRRWSRIRDPSQAVAEISAVRGHLSIGPGVPNGVARARRARSPRPALGGASSPPKETSISPSMSITISDVMDEVRPDLTRRVRPYIAAEP